MYHLSFDFLIQSMIQLSSPPAAKTSQQLSVKAPRCSFHCMWCSLISLVLSIITSNHLFINRLFGGFTVGITVHHVAFPQGHPLLWSACASFVFSSFQAEPASTTVPPKSVVHSPSTTVVVTDNFQVKSYKWKLDPQLELKHSSLELLPQSLPG